MLISFSVILLSGMFGGWICKKLKLPPLFGMLIAGIITGSYMLHLIDETTLSISTEYRNADEFYSSSKYWDNYTK